MTKLKGRSVITLVWDMSTGCDKYSMNQIGFEVLKELEARGHREIRSE